jgi:photosystem II stability/assembly factor-like uncharacterized protein
MKRIYILVIAICMMNIANAQWTTQNSGTQNALFGVYFTDINTGYAVGSNGTIIKTINVGYNWTHLTSGTNVKLHSIYFPNANTGYAAGDNGTIIKTVDYGNTWLAQTNDTTSLESIFFTDANTGFAVGTATDVTLTNIYGVFLKTTNGGSTWTKKYFGPLSSWGLSSVFFTDANNGYVSGIHCFLKTTDGGLNWIDTIHSPGNVYSLFFINSNIGYLTADAAIYKTNDAGKTWTFNYESPYVGSITHIYFPNINTGYAIGDHSLILKTTDAGNSWSVQSYGYSSYDAYNSVFFINENTGYIVGKQYLGGGYILKTTNGGVIGINEARSKNGFILTPNPATTNLTINLQQTSLQNTTVSIYDVQGKLLLQQNITQPQTELNITSFAKGIYVVKVNNDKQCMQSKFVKE